MARSICLSLLLLLGACTGYKPLGTGWPTDDYGYREEQLAPGRYRLEYHARAEVNNAESRARDYWHRRARALCQSNHYQAGPLKETRHCRSYLDYLKFSGEHGKPRQVCQLHLSGTLECTAP